MPTLSKNGKPIGRPSKFSDELAERLCQEIESGRSLKEICESEDWAPSRVAVNRWLEGNESFRARYARARETQCDSLAEKALEIAATATNENAQAVRLHFDAIRWYAGKVAPKKYGERQQIEHAGPDGGAIPHAIEVKFVDAPSPDITKK